MLVKVCLTLALLDTYPSQFAAERDDRSQRMIMRAFLPTYVTTKIRNLFASS